MSKNRFAGLQAVKQLQDNTEIIKEIPQNKTFEQSPEKTKIKSLGSSDKETTPKRGRPSGKRSNTDFQQVTAYIRRDTYRRVSIKLIDREKKGEFSELVEILLKEWLNKHF